MKSAIAAVLLAVTLSACVAVPYEPAPAYGYYGPAPYYYGPPAATFSFGYHSHRHRWHRY